MHLPHNFNHRFPALRLSVAFLFSLIFISCATTRIEESSPCATMLTPASKVLLVHLPEGEEEFVLRQLTSTFQRVQISLDYFPAQEWNLRAAGISNTPNVTHAEALKKLGYSHLLFIDQAASRSESSFAYYTAEEVSLENVPGAYHPAAHERGNQSQVVIHLMPVDDPKAVHRVVSKTTIGHLTIRDKHQGETYVNPTTAVTARNKAIKQGIKRLLKNCSASK